MDIQNLIGTTWILRNDSPGTNVDLNLTFECDGVTYYGLWSSSNDSEILYYKTSSGVVEAYDDGIAYRSLGRTISIIGGSDSASSAAIQELSNLGVRVSTTDLTGTTWILNPTGLRSDGYNSFSITFICYYDAETYYEHFVDHINADPSSLSYDSVVVYEDGMWNDNNFRTITITGGVDSENEDLISFLCENSREVDGAATVSFDVSQISGWQSIADGTHELQIVATNDAYDDSNPSTAVSITKSAEITSLTGCVWCGYSKSGDPAIACISSAAALPEKHISFLAGSTMYSSIRGEVVTETSFSWRGYALYYGSDQAYGPNSWKTNMPRYIKIFGGDDADDSELINWFQQNGTLIPGTPSGRPKHVLTVGSGLTNRVTINNVSVSTFPYELRCGDYIKVTCPARYGLYMPHFQNAHTTQSGNSFLWASTYLQMYNSDITINSASYDTHDVETEYWFIYRDDTEDITDLTGYTLEMYECPNNRPRVSGSSQETRVGVHMGGYSWIGVGGITYYRERGGRYWDARVTNYANNVRSDVYGGSGIFAAAGAVYDRIRQIYGINAYTGQGVWFNASGEILDTPPTFTITGHEWSSLYGYIDDIDNEPSSATDAMILKSLGHLRAPGTTTYESTDLNMVGKLDITAKALADGYEISDSSNITSIKIGQSVAPLSVSSQSSEANRYVTVTGRDAQGYTQYYDVVSSVNNTPTKHIIKYPSGGYYQSGSLNCSSLLPCHVRYGQKNFYNYTAQQWNERCYYCSSSPASVPGGGAGWNFPSRIRVDNVDETHSYGIRNNGILLSTDEDNPTVIADTDVTKFTVDSGIVMPVGTYYYYICGTYTRNNVDLAKLGLPGGYHELSFYGDGALSLPSTQSITAPGYKVYPLIATFNHCHPVHTYVDAFDGWGGPNKLESFPSVLNNGQPLVVNVVADEGYRLPNTDNGGGSNVAVSYDPLGQLTIYPVFLMTTGVASFTLTAETGTQRSITVEGDSLVLETSWDGINDRGIFYPSSDSQKISLNDCVDYTYTFTPNAQGYWIISNEAESGGGTAITSFTGDITYIDTGYIDDPSYYWGGGTAYGFYGTYGKIDGYGTCFVSGTKINMADGSTKNIEDVAYGDRVLSWNFCTGQQEASEICWIADRRGANAHCLVTLSDGTQLRLVGASDAKTHRLYNVTKEKFMYPQEFEPGDQTVNARGEYLSIVSIERVDGSVVYYNLASRNINVYAEGILTSNRLSNAYRIHNFKYTNEQLMSEQEIADYIEHLKSMSTGDPMNMIARRK